MRFINSFDRRAYDEWRTIFHFLATHADYKDINERMVDVGEKYISVLQAAARAGQRARDLARAEALLRRNGLSPADAAAYTPTAGKTPEIVQDSLFAM